MLTFEQVQGAIFDLDDTLLDNGPVDRPGEWLHARSRLAAIHEVAETHDIPVLHTVTPEESSTAFVTASEHSLPGAIWNVFFMKGIVSSSLVDRTHPLYGLVDEIVVRKNELHETILRQYGVEVPGASDFVKSLAVNGLANHLALATNAIRRDIDIFLSMYGLSQYFPDERVISAEKVTRPKPDPEAFNLAFRALELPNSARRNVWAFEDNPRGMLSAKGAGLYVCAITTRLGRDDPGLLAAKPDLVADSFAEFRELLQVPA